MGIYVAESCTIAFPWVFTINNNARYGNHEGPGEIQLAVSRDLDKWDRQFRDPIVPRGRVGEWDSGFFTTISRALRVGDEVWIYYTGSNYTHGTPCISRAEGTGRGTKYTGSIGLAKWKLNRFVSADGGTLTSVPLKFDGSKLELNAVTKEGGEVVAEMLDLKGNQLAASDPITGDSLRHQVNWNTDISKFAGKPIVLRFHLSSSELYAFGFRR